MAVSLHLGAMLGIKPTISGAVAYLDETDVQYVSGRCLVRFDTETRQQKIVPGAVDSFGITATAVTEGKSKLSAYAEFLADRTPIVHIYDWASRKKKRTITGLDTRHAPITHLAFAPDGKHIVAQGGAPEFVLSYIALERGATARVLATLKNVTTPGKPVSHVSVHPGDATLVAISGRGFLRFVRLVDDMMRAVQLNLRRDPTVFLCHCWLPDDRLVVGTQGGEVWLLEGTEFKRVLTDSAPGAGGAASAVGKAVTSLVAFPKGFIAGCDGGMLRVFERVDDIRLFFKHTKTFTVGGDDVTRVTALALSPNEEDLAVVCASGQAYGFKLASYELYKPGDLAFKPLVALFHTQPTGMLAGAAGGAGADRAATGSDYEPGLLSDAAGPGVLPTAAAPGGAAGGGAGAGAGTGPGAGGARRSSLGGGTSAAALEPWSQPNYGITGLDACVRKPIFVTCGADRTVRIWSYRPLHGGEGGAAGGAGAGASAPTTARPASDLGMGSLGHLELCPQLELVQRFPETPNCVSVHPTGLQMVVGFESSLQLLTVLMDSLRVFKEFPIRNCPDVRFSHSGAMFAAINGSVISVFGTYSCAPIASLRAHSDRVLSFIWSRDDRFIISIGRDGLAIRYSVIVPNATSAVSTGVATGTTAASSAAASLAAAALHTSSVGGDRVSGLSGLAIGKAVNTYEIRDFTPLSVGHGALENGREVVVTGVVVRNGASTTIMRYIDLAAPLRDAPKADIPMGGHTVRNCLALVPSRLLVAGMGHSIERHKLGPALLTDAASRTLQERARPAAGGDGGHGDSGAALGGSAGLSSLAGGIVGSGVTSEATAAAAVAAAAGPITAAFMGGIDAVGVVRVYRLPPSVDHTDFVCHAGGIARMLVTPDERVVITAGTDGSIAIFAALDARPRSTGAGVGAAAAGAAAGPGSSGGDEALPYADEILVTRADLEEVRKEKVELDARVQEIKMTNRYNERYKEMSNDEKIREVEEKFAEELKADRAKHEELRDAKAEMEAKFEEQLAEMEAAHARELEELEVTYRAKITGEMERYDALVKDRDVMNEEFDTANAALVKEQSAAVEALKAKYEGAIRAEQDATTELEERKRRYQEEFAQLADDIELDVDGEMEDMRARYEGKLQTESKATTMLRLENGFMKRRFTDLTRQLNEKKDEMTALAEKERELHEAIAALQKDVAGHKKEIRDREETLAGKEARIYDLKKKNQELEKFKYVLNYKIQELKRQIMPRKREIQDMREQMKEMELELLQYHKSNAALDLMIGELKLKRDGMQREVDKLQGLIDAKDEELTKISRDVAAVYSTMRDAKMLRAAVVRLYRKYIHGDTGNLASAIAKMDATTAAATTAAAAGAGAGAGAGADAGGESRRGVPVGVDVADVQRELARQRMYLERNIDGMRRKMEKDEVAARVDHARLMRENMVLTQELNELRRDLRYVQGEVTKLANALLVPLGVPAGAAVDADGAPLDITAMDVAAATEGLGLDELAGPDDGDVTRGAGAGADWTSGGDGGAAAAGATATATAEGKRGESRGVGASMARAALASAGTTGGSGAAAASSDVLDDAMTRAHAITSALSRGSTATSTRSGRRTGALHGVVVGGGPVTPFGAAPPGTADGRAGSSATATMGAGAGALTRQGTYRERGTSAGGAGASGLAAAGAEALRSKAEMLRMGATSAV